MDSPTSEAAAVEVLKKKKEVTPVTRKIAIRSSFLRTLVGRSSFLLAYDPRIHTWYILEYVQDFILNVKSDPV